MNEAARDAFNHELLCFLGASPTPFHAVGALASLLEEGGFRELREQDAWACEAGGRYFVRRNGSSLIAFVRGRAAAEDAGLRMAGAHTDSPCLRLKPRPELRRSGYLQFGVEVYGGALLNPWFDRDLSIAGRVSYATAGGVAHALIDFREPVAVIPSLAIHLDREANSGRAVNAQNHLPALLALADSEPRDFAAIVLGRLREEHPHCGAVRVLDCELSLYDTQPPRLVGLHREFIAGARLDNLLSCFAGVHALMESDGEFDAIMVCNDHEEVGSVSAAGAQGPMLNSLLARLLPERERRERALASSLMISADNAHGVHPNFADKHDGNHGPALNAGPVIKVNASQRYATNSETAALFRWLCEAEGVPVQSFAVRSDMACGSTIGPLTAANVGVRTLDVGVPTFAMHSPRELAGTSDLHALARVLSRFFRQPAL
ncbi:MAG: M18 family aminopeptidase [Gammaproteobacteria bacterium]|jgi:aspartyl aminopeptidase|nr:M18 family aminopeptidase [Gammaproteobacteria bacterium]MBP6480934.1 M18 family aminopeptidase [Pseudomonadales bacterium]MBP7909749.1 M18 family aminopeptidase [Pseudomonadales bacterium]